MSSAHIGGDKVVAARSQYLPDLKIELPQHIDPGSGLVVQRRGVHKDSDRSSQLTRRPSANQRRTPSLDTERVKAGRVDARHPRLRLTPGPERLS